MFGPSINYHCSNPDYFLDTSLILHINKRIFLEMAETPRSRFRKRDYRDLQGKKIKPPIPTDFSDSEETDRFYSFPDLSVQSQDRLTDRAWVYRLVEIVDGVNIRLFII